jgi:FemAB-related protein (PEP-CTERM system-associated)
LGANLHIFDGAAQPRRYTAPAVRVERVADPGAEWDAFVEASPGAVLGHAAAWARVVEEAYGLAPHYLAAREEGGALLGVLPLVLFRSLRGRRELVSLPFHDSAGLLARTPEAERALVDAALALAAEQGARSVELRQPAPLAWLSAPQEVDRVDLLLTLEEDEERQWKAFRAQVRNQTRKAEKEGLTIAPGDPQELVDEFYAPFAVNMRDLGSPVHAKAFYQAAARHLGERLRFVVTRLGQRPVGGLVAVHYAGKVTVTWASTLRAERRRCPNNLIYWEAIRWAIARGAREFDFGRSPRDAGTYRFKRGWGAREVPLAWLRLDRAGRPAEIPTAEAGSWMRRLSSLWRHLPVPVSAVLGPRVRRYLAN